MAGFTRSSVQQPDQGHGQGSPLDEQVRQWLVEEELLTAERASGPGWVAVAAGVVIRQHLPCTALYQACTQGRLAFCQWLFEHGAAKDVRRQVAYGLTPMLAACMGGHLAVCQWLFEHGAAEDVRMTTHDGRWHPMLAACTWGHLAVCQWLFEHGAAEDVRTANNGGRTPMIAACGAGHLAVCQWLFEHGAAEDIRTANNDGSTPMSDACFHCKLPVCQWLIAVGGPALLDNDRVRLNMRADTRAQLVGWVQARLALHECFSRVVLLGMMHKRSGSRLLWMMGGGGASIQPRMLVAHFLGVPLRGELGNLRGALAVVTKTPEHEPGGRLGGGLLGTAGGVGGVAAER